MLIFWVTAGSSERYHTTPLINIFVISKEVTAKTVFLGEQHKRKKEKTPHFNAADTSLASAVIAEVLVRN